MSIEFDVSELRTLAADLGKADARAASVIKATTSKAALNIKTTLRGQAGGHSYFPAFPYSITYDLTIRAGSITAEIGPDKDMRQGALGNILYFGTSNNGPVLPDPGEAMDKEAPSWQEYLGKAVADVMLP